MTPRRRKRRIRRNLRHRVSQYIAQDLNELFNKTDKLQSALDKLDPASAIKRKADRIYTRRIIQKRIHAPRQKKALRMLLQYFQIVNR